MLLLIFSVFQLLILLYLVTVMIFIPEEIYTYLQKSVIWLSIKRLYLYPDLTSLQNKQIKGEFAGDEIWRSCKDKYGKLVHKISGQISSTVLSPHSRINEKTFYSIKKEWMNHSTCLHVSSMHAGINVMTEFWNTLISNWKTSASNLFILRIMVVGRCSFRTFNF